jgi:hypothetical protein
LVASSESFVDISGLRKLRVACPSAFDLFEKSAKLLPYLRDSYVECAVTDDDQ